MTVHMQGNVRCCCRPVQSSMLYSSRRCAIASSECKGKVRDCVSDDCYCGCATTAERLFEVGDKAVALSLLCVGKCTSGPLR
jgi:hypothetical protein